MAFIERKVNDVKWDKPGVCAAGYLLRIVPVEFEGKRNLSYILKNEGGLVRFFGTSELNVKIDPSDVGQAAMVELTEIQDLGGGRTHKNFRVRFDPSNSIGGTGVEPAPAAPGSDQWAGEKLEITDADIPF